MIKNEKYKKILNSMQEFPIDSSQSIFISYSPQKEKFLFILFNYKNQDKLDSYLMPEGDYYKNKEKYDRSHFKIAPFHLKNIRDIDEEIISNIFQFIENEIIINFNQSNPEHIDHFNKIRL